MYRHRPRAADPDVRGRGTSLRAGGARRPARGRGYRVRGRARRRSGLAAARRRAPAERDPHPGGRAPGAARLRVVPRRRAAARAVHAAARRGRRGLRRRRPVGVLPASAGRYRAVARRAAADRRPGLRGRGEPRDAGVHPRPPGRVAAARRGGRRLRGVHPPVPRGVDRPRHPLAAVDRAERDGVRRSRRDRRLEHLLGVGRGCPQPAMVGRPHHRRVHVVLDLPAPGEPGAARARRGGAVRAGRGR